jgi:hypothetical protein
LADLDGDADLDAFVGTSEGLTLFFANTGTPSAPAFAPPATNPFGLADVGYFAAPAFADLDGDGDLDAFVGTVYGSTVFFANTGTAAAPAFAPPVTSPFGPAPVASRQSLAFADVDGDRDLDLLLGFRVPDTRITCGMTSASLTGRTRSGPAIDGGGTDTGGIHIEGSDRITTVGCRELSTRR